VDEEPIDHRAAALANVDRGASRTEESDREANRCTWLARAQVHATLAVAEARSVQVQGVDPRYDGLRAAVRDALAVGEVRDGGILVPIALAGRLHELAGGE
jgi:hypothetical protein